jgi:hypothetical protein
MAIELDVVAEIEAEQKRAAAKSAGGNASFFVLKNGEKALVRPLLNLNACASIWKHDFYNQATGKYEVNALCAQSLDLPAECCKHCMAAKSTGNKKLSAIKLFIVPLYVYGIKNSDGQAITYTDQEGNEKSVSGVRFLSLKGTSDMLATLVTMFREGTNISSSDLTITRKGEKLLTSYTILPRPPAPFAVEGIPAQYRDSIVERINELNPAEIIDGPDTDHFGSNPPAQSNGAKPAPAKASVPDF